MLESPGRSREFNLELSNSLSQPDRKVKILKKKKEEEEEEEETERRSNRINS